MEFTKEQLAAELNKLDPTKPLGTALHAACVRLSPAIAIEAVILKNVGEAVHVLLRRRSDDEPSYPGQHHCPGSFIRHREGIPEVLQRLTDKEGIGSATSYELVNNHFWMEERGWICSAIYLVHVDENADPARSRWYPVNALPQPMVEEHERVIIPAALERYRQKR